MGSRFSFFLIPTDLRDVRLVASHYSAHKALSIKKNEANLEMFEYEKCVSKMCVECTQMTSDNGFEFARGKLIVENNKCTKIQKSGNCAAPNERCKLQLNSFNLYCSLQLLTPKKIKKKKEKIKIEKAYELEQLAAKG